MDDLDPKQFFEMISFQQLEGTGYWNSWSQTALLASLMANLWTTGRRYGPNDFMPSEPAEPVTEEQMQRQWMALKQRPAG